MADLISRAERALKSAHLTSRALVELIREINPTGRGLPAATEQRRYQLKSRLQSLLLRRHFDEIRLQPDAASPGLIGLLHSPSNSDACHALLDELDLDVRSRVRFALDTAAPPAPPPPAAPANKHARTSTNDLLATGRRALADYDFDAARSAFSAAFDQELPDAPELLLELLVDHLAAYDDALALEDRLSDPSPRALTLLSTAAARAARLPDLLRLSAGLSDPALAPAFTEAARLALSRSDLHDAARLLDRAHSLDPTHPDLLSLSADLARARAASRAPAEDELLRLLATADPALVRQRATSLLASWPDSAVARRALRDLDERSRRSLAEQLTSDADAAAARGDHARALSLYGDAVAHGASGLDARISAARQHLDSAHARARTAHAAALLQRSFDLDACAAFLDLDPAQRAEVRSGAGGHAPALSWLEELARDTHRRELPQLVDALRALAAPPSPALLRHEPVLSKLEAGRRALDALRADERARALAAESLRLAAARAAFDEGRHADVVSQLTGFAPGAELLARAQRELDAAQRRRDFAAALTAHDALRGLEVLRSEEYATAAPHLEWRRALQPLLRQAFEHHCGPLSHVPELSSLRYVEGAGRWVDAARGHAYWATAFGRQLCVYRLELATGRALSACVVTTPEPFSVVHVHVSQGLVAVSGLSGAFVVLDGESWDIVDWRPLAHVAADEVVEEVLAVPAARYAWLWVRINRSNEDSLRVVDLERDRVHREISQPGMLQLLAGAGEVRVAVNGFNRPSRIFSLGGQPDASLPGEVFEACCAPDGKRFAGVENVEGGPLKIWLCEPGGQSVRCDELEDSDFELPRAFATSLAARRWYLLAHALSSPPRLHCYAQDGWRLVRQWSVDAPYQSTLIGDLASERVFLLMADRSGPRCVELGEAAPGLGPPGDVPVPLPGGSISGLWCWPTEGLTGSRAAGEVSRVPSAEARRQILSRAVDACGDPWEAVDIAVTLGRWRRPEDAGVALELAEQRHRGHGAVALGRAELAFQRGELGHVDAPLRAARAAHADFGPRQTAHLLHVEGICCFARGEAAEALARFDEAAEIEECTCDLEGWLSFLRASLGAAGAGEREVELIAAVRRADAATARGDSGAALRELDCPVVWQALDDQLAARLVTAALGAPDVPALRQRIIVAAAFERLSEEDRRQLPFGDEALPPEELAAALGFARAALGIS